MIVLFTFLGCSWVGPNAYQERVQDADGDGAVSERFGGPDCRDDDPEILDCDADGDGHLAATLDGDDCDDGDPNSFPGAPEVCDGADNDCNGLADNDDPEVASEGVFFVDEDGDGFGDPSRTRACQEFTEPANPASRRFVTLGEDCDDTNAEVNPVARELCDEIDNDCDGNIDDVGLWFLDEDDDGYGRDGTQVSGDCNDPVGLAPVGGDCDDDDPSRNPGTSEIPYDGIDQDCAPGPDEWDSDGDGYVPTEHWTAAAAAGFTLHTGDCDDQEAAAHLGAVEICDGIDNDCDLATDSEDLLGAGPLDEATLRTQVVEVFVDQDGDGFHGTPLSVCPDEIDPTHSTVSDDCADDPEGGFAVDVTLIHPGAAEGCDGADNDCDGRIDWAPHSLPGFTPHYLDHDGDGFGVEQVFACSPRAEDGIVLSGLDCDDTTVAVFPGAPEICGDGTRQDCSTASLYDCDGDGFEGSYAGNGDDSDCDDGDAQILPTTAPGWEICDGVDNDCDGHVDSADPDNLDLSGQPLWLPDLDHDGFGAGTGIQQCDAPADHVLIGGDCDDHDPTSNPSTPWFLDLDHDGFGGDLDIVTQCLAPGLEWIREGGDCNDLDATLNPSTQWRPDHDGDGVGNPSEEVTACVGPEAWVQQTAGDDCDDQDSTVQETRNWYLDLDADGFGHELTPSCGAPSNNHVLQGGDCDDLVASRHPQAVELCNQHDDDCDGLIDDDDPSVLATPGGPVGYPDLDGDGVGAGSPKNFCSVVGAGWSEVQGDCDDDDAQISPLMPEICGNSHDEDCDGFTDVPSWYVDSDLDGFGSGTPVTQCDPPTPTGYSSRSDDCDDTDVHVFPGAPEVATCDAIDADCDGTPEPLLTWTFDADGDGYGDDATAEPGCSPPIEPPHPGLTGSWGVLGGDCDDTDPNLTFGRLFFRDADEDGLGDPAAPRFACPETVGQHEQVTVQIEHVTYTTVVGDCDDIDGQIGLPSIAFIDGDSDGFGSQTGVPACPGQLGSLVSNNSDCDDHDPQVFPDQGCIAGGLPWYIDTDGDGWGTDADVQYAPARPDGYVGLSGDCDDTNTLVHPGMNELCDGLDNNCDGWELTGTVHSTFDVGNFASGALIEQPTQRYQVAPLGGWEDAPLFGCGAGAFDSLSIPGLQDLTILPALDAQGQALTGNLMSAFLPDDDGDGVPSFVSIFEIWDGSGSGRAAFNGTFDCDPDDPDATYLVGPDQWVDADGDLTTFPAVEGSCVGTLPGVMGDLDCDDQDHTTSTTASRAHPPDQRTLDHLAEACAEAEIEIDFPGATIPAFTHPNPIIKLFGNNAEACRLDGNACFIGFDPNALELTLEGIGIEFIPLRRTDSTVQIYNSAIRFVDIRGVANVDIANSWLSVLGFQTGLDDILAVGVRDSTFEGQGTAVSMTAGTFGATNTTFLGMRSVGVLEEGATFEGTDVSIVDSADHALEVNNGSTFDCTRCSIHGEGATQLAVSGGNLDLRDTVITSETQHGIEMAPTGSITASNLVLEGNQQQPALRVSGGQVSIQDLRIRSAILPLVVDSTDNPVDIDIDGFDLDDIGSDTANLAPILLGATNPLTVALRDVHINQPVIPTNPFFVVVDQGAGARPNVWIDGMQYINGPAAPDRVFSVFGSAVLEVHNADLFGVGALLEVQGPLTDSELAFVDTDVHLRPRPSIAGLDLAGAGNAHLELDLEDVTFSGATAAGQPMVRMATEGTGTADLHDFRMLVAPGDIRHGLWLEGALDVWATDGHIDTPDGTAIRLSADGGAHPAAPSFVGEGLRMFRGEPASPSGQPILRVSDGATVELAHSLLWNHHPSLDHPLMDLMGPSNVFLSTTTLRSLNPQASMGLVHFIDSFGCPTLHAERALFAFPGVPTPVFNCGCPEGLGEITHSWASVTGPGFCDGPLSLEGPVSTGVPNFHPDLFTPLNPDIVLTYGETAL